ncbi:MAG: aldo/keto reductase [Chloroflexi bacterium RBG_19FT_COMBO_56_12]|nr:MAG: aldo/keto reductase [Chloroflexi bacterium RBG_19FT_COMBO_56_12]
MRYKLLGHSGLRVAELCLGTMTFGEDWGWGASKEESRKIFDAYVEAGGNFIDTSINYTNGSAEKYVGEFIVSDRDRFVVATKFSLSTRKDDPNAGGNHRKNMMQAVEVSLKRLNTDHIDLYWMHMWDMVTPIEEVMHGLDDLVRAGKVLYVGISDTPAWLVAQANTLASMRGWSPFVALQIPYSLADRSPERELLPMAHAFDLAVLAWGVLEAGELTGKYNQPTSEPKRNQQPSARNLKLAETVIQVARERGCSPAQLAINWVRQQQDKSLIIPILGARSLKHIQENLACLNYVLTGEELQQLSDASPIDLGFPRSFLEDDFVRGLIFGDTLGRIDHRRR